MNKFIFETYSFSKYAGEASFRYRFSDGRHFEERVQFSAVGEYDEVILDRAMFLAFLVIGTSYYKAFPTTDVGFEIGQIDEWQANFLNNVYQEGLSQYAFENGLQRSDLAHFLPTINQPNRSVPYSGRGKLVLQSGGKDSLLLASLLNEKGEGFTPWYLASTEYYPEVLNHLGYPVVTARRIIDHDALTVAASASAKNGHIPVTYITLSLAVVQAVLLGKNEVLAAIAHEGEEPHARVGDLSITHQWSKTWHAEQLFSEYIKRYISPDINVGSPLRRYSELRVAELFVKYAWGEFGQSFSSCNSANYGQAHNNTKLQWCADCPKCANSYLLFAPFVQARELQSLFDGKDLFEESKLQETFKGLLGAEGVMKPFECVGEVGELQTAYHWAQRVGGYGQVSFEVPTSEYDYIAEYPYQASVSI